MVVVASFTEIKTGYWGFETKSGISYACSVHWNIIRGAYMSDNF